jgi:rhomboid protease GluP
MTQSEDRPGVFAQNDGEMDFTGYTDAQLRDLRDHIDAVRFPVNLQKLAEEIHHREQEGATRRFAIRFTSADGFVGWVQALFSFQPFYGSGSIAAEPGQILIEGWRRTWLGTGQQSETAVPSDRIRNVYSDHEWVSFDVRRRILWSRHHMMRAADASAASAVARLLPTSRSKWFDKQATEIRDFYRLLRAPNRQPWVTTLLVLACLGVYLVQAVMSGSWLAADGLLLVNWGANVGQLTVHGAWWRLLSCLFLHVSLLHLAVNMWVLWSAGRLTERLFGNVAFAVIYTAAGLMGGLLSIAWNPAVSSVGASGAIFGILGAYIAYLIHGDTKIPRPVMRARLIPTLLFIIFSILDGLLQSGIDNAAHAGGLLTGFLLGWAGAPMSGRQLETSAKVRSVAAILLVVLGAAGLLLEITGAASQQSPAEQFLAANAWYSTGEAKNLQRWQEIAGQAAAGTISDADLARRFETEIVPFWRQAEPRLRKQISTAPQASSGFPAALADFAGLRLRWARAIVAGARSGNPQDAVRMMNRTDAAQARLDWFALRAQFDHQAKSVAESGLVTGLENIAWLNYRPCAEYPFRDFNPVAPGDLASDGPARRQALKCLAQHLFMTRDFQRLDNLLAVAARHPNDLADGRSSYDALFDGIDNLFEYGGISVNATMVRLAEWRRAMPGSVHADLAEVSALVAWGYAARGVGVANTITAQNLQLFQHRINIAQAALTAMAPRGKKWAQWYAQSIQVNLLGNGKEEERQALFNEGHALFPDDANLDTEMLHALMPRWGGAFEKVARFIAAQVSERTKASPSQDARKRYLDATELYAELYWRYATLEAGNADIFKDVYADPDTVSMGMAVAMKRHPKSDYVANVAGRLACQSDRRLEYLVFHGRLPKHYSASAWSPDFSVEACNKKFGLKS